MDFKLDGFELDGFCHSISSSDFESDGLIKFRMANHLSLLTIQSVILNKVANTLKVCLIITKITVGNLQCNPEPLS